MPQSTSTSSWGYCSSSTSPTASKPAATNCESELTKDGIKGEQLDGLLESRDEYTAERVFWVPPEARWTNLQNQATRPDIATLIDDAILAVERDNPNLKGKLPRDYARRGIEPVKIKSLIDLIAGIGFKGSRGKARDMLGRVYEYFLGKFAAAEGKLGGEFYTPRSVVRVLVEMLEPYEGRIYDPACGSGGMFVQSEKFVEAHGGRRTDVSIFGQETNPTTWRLAHMNLASTASRPSSANSRPTRSSATSTQTSRPTSSSRTHRSTSATGLANSCAATSDGSMATRLSAMPTTRGSNTSSTTLPTPMAGAAVSPGSFMANGSLSSNTGGEGEIRRKIVEADLVDCIVALPAQLFFTTGIPVCLWFLTRDKTGRNIRRGTPNRPGGRRGETLFIDARKLGTMQTRVLRVLTGVEDDECVPGTGDPLPASDVGRIVYTFRRWRGEPAPDWWNEKEYGPWAFLSTAGFAKPATIEEIAKHGHVLTPGRYVGAEEQADDAEPFAEKYRRLVAELEEQLENGERLADVIRKQLAGLADE